MPGPRRGPGAGRQPGAGSVAALGAGGAGSGALRVLPPPALAGWCEHQPPPRILPALFVRDGGALSALQAERGAALFYSRVCFLLAPLPSLPALLGPQPSLSRIPGQRSSGLCHFAGRGVKCRFCSWAVPSCSESPAPMLRAHLWVLLGPHLQRGQPP